MQHNKNNQWVCIDCKTERNKPEKWSDNYNPIGVNKVMICENCDKPQWHKPTILN